MKPLQPAPLLNLVGKHFRSSGVSHRYASALLGTIVMDYETIETGVAAPADAFSRPAAQADD